MPVPPPGGDAFGGEEDSLDRSPAGPEAAVAAAAAEAARVPSPDLIDFSDMPLIRPAVT